MQKRLITYIVLIFFLASTMMPYGRSYAAETVITLPTPGSMVFLSSVYEPVLVKGLTIHKDNPFLFDFVVDTGNSNLTSTDSRLKTEADRLIKYFFACLTIPEKDLWVNLSPYEKDRMLPEALGKTALGRDLLAEDYILKQISASLIYPEKGLGKEFWNRVYTKAQQMYGSSDIPMNTFNKIWILADKATVYEHGQTAFVINGHLRVMLESDYLALQKYSEGAGHAQPVPGKDVNGLGSQIVREIVIPEIEKEVNTGKNFAPLRQIFNSLILAKWYKKNLKEALLNQVYADKSTVKGVNLNDSSAKEEIYQQYLKAYKKGVFNFIKEDIQTDGQKILRKYFSGGFGANVDLNVSHDAVMAEGIQVNPSAIKVEVSANTNSNSAMAAVDVVQFKKDAQSLFQEQVLSQRDIETLDQKALGSRLKNNGNIYRSKEEKNSRSNISVNAFLDESAQGIVSKAIEMIQHTEGAVLNPVHPEEVHASLFLLKDENNFKKDEKEYRLATAQEVEQQQELLKQYKIFGEDEPLSFEVAGVHLTNNGGVIVELRPLSDELAYIQNRAKDYAVKGSCKQFFYATVGYLRDGTTTAGIQHLIQSLANYSAQIKGTKVATKDIAVSNDINRRPSGERISVFDAAMAGKTYEKNKIKEGKKIKTRKIKSQEEIFEWSPEDEARWERGWDAWSAANKKKAEAKKKKAKKNDAAMIVFDTPNNLSLSNIDRDILLTQNMILNLKKPLPTFHPMPGHLRIFQERILRSDDGSVADSNYLRAGELLKNALFKNFYGANLSIDNEGLWRDIVESDKESAIQYLTTLAADLQRRKTAGGSAAMTSSGILQKNEEGLVLRPEDFNRPFSIYLHGRFFRIQMNDQGVRPLWIYYQSSKGNWSYADQVKADGLYKDIHEDSLMDIGNFYRFNIRYDHEKGIHIKNTDERPLDYSVEFSGTKSAAMKSSEIDQAIAFIDRLKNEKDWMTLLVINQDSTSWQPKGLLVGELNAVQKDVLAKLIFADDIKKGIVPILASQANRLKLEQRLEIGFDELQSLLNTQLDKIRQEYVAQRPKEETRKPVLVKSIKATLSGKLGGLQTFMLDQEIAPIPEDSEVILTSDASGQGMDITDVIESFPAREISFTSPRLFEFLRTADLKSLRVEIRSDKAMNVTNIPLKIGRMNFGDRIPDIPDGAGIILSVKSSGGEQKIFLVRSGDELTAYDAAFNKLGEHIGGVHSFQITVTNPVVASISFKKDHLMITEQGKPELIYKGVIFPYPVDDSRSSIIVSDTRMPLAGLQEDQQKAFTSFNANILVKRSKGFLIAEVSDAQWDREVSFSLNNAAMNTQLQKAYKLGIQKDLPPGGIDLNSSNMGMTVTKDPNGGVKVNLDPAMLEKIKKEGISSVVPVIINITPVGDIRPLLGLASVSLSNS